ncbi:MAG: heavy metal translocating P-type ATPase [Rickettsiales bacterium]
MKNAIRICGCAISKSFIFSQHIILVTLSLLAIALYFSLPEDIKNIPLQIVTIIGSIPLLLNIIKQLIKLDMGADILAAIALVTAAIVGEYLAAVLIIIMLAGGQALEEYAMRKASSVLSALAERMPTIAYRKNGNEILEIAISDIKIGDSIVVYPHETCPVDGTVIDGHSTMDESYLTGEPYHISKAKGSSVISGSINGESPLTIKAEKLPSDSRYAKIMHVMREAEEKRPAMRRLGDQIGAIFAPIALLIAVLAWYFTGDSIRFLAVLVVATPCPLLIAIPITIISAISLAAKHAIIIKDPTVLERLPTCKTAIFDKTGTLTYGIPEITDIKTAREFDKNDILSVVATIEQYSKHPLSHAIIRKAKKLGIELQEAQSVSEKAGFGLSGVVGGKEIKITSRKKISIDKPELLNELPESEAGLECVIIVDGKYAATFIFRDAAREDGHSFINHLAPNHQFTKIMLVSGDRESEVSYLAGLMGIKDMLSSQTPEQKLALVRKETKNSPTLFMGDGINDAPALTAATVGIAFGQASSVTAEAAGAVIMENTLTKVDELIHISEDMRRVAIQSAVGGMILSFIGMGFAATGNLSPVGGAIAQEVIDIIAIGWALRLTWQKKVETDI